MIVARVLQKGQIVIPKDVREAVHLQPGDKVEVKVTREGVLLQPLHPHPSLTEQFRGSVKGKLSMDDLEILYGQKP